jgi:putative Ca2+/H+ antiporter (TMEM165/GDT1 family)
MNWQLFVSTFVTIFLAELGDKTQFAAVAASSKAESLKEVLLAVVLALSLAGALGVLAGKALAAVLNPEWMRWISGSMFILVGLWVLISK